MPSSYPSTPFVSCVMPTADRRAFVPQAIRYFLAQDYPHKELVVVDDGREAVADLIPADPRVRYVRLEGRRTLGEKRNECVRLARGDLIMHWDDDDWMAPRRIGYQVEALLGAGAEVCGLRHMLFYELAADKLWLYEYPPGGRPWLAGGSLLYTRDFWRRAPFPDLQVASDTSFIYGQQLRRAAVLHDHTFYVAMIHPGNTSPKRLASDHWKPLSFPLESVAGEDARFYRSLAAPPAAAPDEAAAPARLKEDETPGAENLKIGYVLLNFPPLSETFIRREVLELCRRGHRVFVYALYRHHDPLVPEPAEPRLTMREVDFRRDPAALAAAIRDDNVQHLHSSLMLAAQRAAFRAARALQIPFTLTAYSGHDVFTARDPRLFTEMTADPLCEALIVEDDFMRGWVTERLGALDDKVTVIPNSFDTGLYRLRAPRPRRASLRVLAVARFVEKKGLIHLVSAFQKVSSAREDVELWLVGGGPEEARLRATAGRNTRIRFLGAMSEEETRRVYEEADIFCAPCVRPPSMDADGIPTTVLEAMSYELPVVVSDLLSTPSYVRDEQEGLLTPPGDEQAVAAALYRLCEDADLRERLGRAGRARVKELCNLGRNVRRLEEVIGRGRRRRWQQCVDALVERRKGYTPEREHHYERLRRQSVAFFAPISGRVLDIGCGTGQMAAHMPEGASYVGCDPVVADPPPRGFPFFRAHGEALPFAAETFDGVMLNCVLPNVFSVAAVLAEAARVLRPGGQLFMRECVNDTNPIHLNHFTPSSMRRAVGEHFGRVETRGGGEQMLLLKATKVAPTAPPSAGRAVARRKAGPAAREPLASVAITSYNRERFLREAIDSALGQTYRPLEVVVIDDGSTDGTPRLVEAYGGRVRFARNERNRGIAGAKNQALRMTSPEARYVCLLDSDDYYHPRFVERCVEFLEENPAFGLVYTDDVLIDAEGRELRRREAVEPWSVGAWLRTCNLRGDTWLARRDLVMQTSLHDESLSHDVDYDLFYQLLELTTFAHLREFLVYYRQHEGQSGRQALDLARCHAANLVKYGHSPEYAYRRARQHPEWAPAIEEGIALGRVLRARRAGGKARTPENGKPDGGASARAREEARAALAVEGGEPVRATLLPFGAPCLGEEEIGEVVETLRSGWIGTGPKAARFEEEFADYVGVRHAVALNSCTAGLFLALVALGVGPGDEVITTPLTFAATVNVIEHTGARPVLADIDSETLNLSPAEVERAVTPRTRAVIPVHFGGLGCDMAALSRIAESRGLFVVEDAAHAAGTRVGGRMAGSLGRAASFSFYANKNLTTAEGGMFTTDDEELARKVRTLSLHGLSGDAWRRFNTPALLRPDVLAPGYKFNMPDLAASLGIHQLRKQERFLETRERYAALYDEAFAYQPLKPQPRPRGRPGDRHSLHLYALTLEGGWGVHRDRVVEALLAENVGAAIHYRAVHTHPFYRNRYGYRPEDFPLAFGASERILSLPLSPGMSEQDVSDVIRAVRKVAAAYSPSPHDGPGAV